MNKEVKKLLKNENNSKKLGENINVAIHNVFQNCLKDKNIG